MRNNDIMGLNVVNKGSVIAGSNGNAVRHSRQILAPVAKLVSGEPSIPSPGAITQQDLAWEIGYSPEAANTYLVRVVIVTDQDIVV